MFCILANRFSRKRETAQNLGFRQAKINYIHIVTCEDVDENISCFFMVVCANCQFVYIIKKITQRLEDMNIILSCAPSKEKISIILYLPLKNKIHSFVPPCNILYHMKWDKNRTGKQRQTAVSLTPLATFFFNKRTQLQGKVILYNPSAIQREDIYKIMLSNLTEASPSKYNFFFTFFTE